MSSLGAPLVEKGRSPWGNQTPISGLADRPNIDQTAVVGSVILVVALMRSCVYALMRLGVRALGRYCVRSRWGSVGRFAGLPLILGPPIALGRRRWGAGCRRRGCRRRLSTLRLSSLRRPGEPRRAGYTASAVPLFSTDGVIWSRKRLSGPRAPGPCGLGLPGEWRF